MVNIDFIHVNFSKRTRFFHHDIFFFYYNRVGVQIFTATFIGRLHLLCFLQRNCKLVFQFIITHHFLFIWRICNYLLWVTLSQSVIIWFKIRSVRKLIHSRTLMTLQFTIRIRNFLFNLNEFVVTAVFKAFFGIIRIVILKLFAIHKVVFNDIL